MSVDEIIRLIDVITNLIKAIIWPGTILFILLRFREPIGKAINDILSRLTDLTLKGPGFEASLNTSDLNIDNLEEEINTPIESIVTSQEVIETFQKADKDEIKGKLLALAGDISKEIRESSFVRVDVSAITGTEGNVFEWPLSAFDYFNQLADKVFIKLQGKVKPYTYGETWVLRDKKSKNIIKSIGMEEGVIPGRVRQDGRTLAEARISGGQELEAIFIPVV